MRGIASARAAWIIAAAGAIAYVVIAPPSADLAAQSYRAGLFGRAGFTLWNNGWYAGHHTPAYSVLFPPLGAALGVRVAGALAAVVAVVLFQRLARGRWGAQARWGSVWFAAAMTVELFTGRMAFTLGIAAALAALVALQERRHGVAVLLGALTTLCSPVAGLFLALAAATAALAGDAGRPRTARLLTAGAAAVAGLGLSVLFPEGGSEPFVASAFWPALAAVAAVAYLLPARERGLRLGAALYALGCVAAFAVSTPVGGNVTRLGALFGAPVLLCAAAGHRRPAVLAALAVPLAYWSLYPAVRDVSRAAGEPAVAASYYAPLLGFLQAQPGPFRIEIPVTRDHWEADRVAPHIPLARGWERQLDRRDAALFYSGRLTPGRYRRWLDDYAVRYVALPDAPLDPSALAEAALLRRGAPWLRPVWRSRHWRVFAVAGATPLAEGAVSDVSLSADGFALDARAPGDVLVRVHHTRWWKVTSGAACVTSAPGDWTLVRVRAAGRIAVHARLLGSSCRA